MKLLQELAIWYLRKSKCSVAINLVLQGEMKVKERKSYVWSCDFYKDYFIDQDGYKIPVVNGSWEFRRTTTKGE